MWLLVLAAVDVPGGCFFFSAVFECLRVQWTREKESWLFISAHLQGSCVSGCSISANFGGFNAPVELLGGRVVFTLNSGTHQVSVLCCLAVSLLRLTLAPAFAGS